MEKRLTLNKRNSRVIKNKKDAWKFDTERFPNSILKTEYI